MSKFDDLTSRVRVHEYLIPGPINPEKPAAPPAEAAPPEPAPREKSNRIDGIVIGCLISLDWEGAPYVTFPGSPPDGLPARAAAILKQEDLGNEVALMFECGDPERPIITGRIVTPTHDPQGPDRIEFKAGQEIVLRCGRCTITITNGTITIEGGHLTSRAEGMNRIEGGVVSIN
jgi:uncharacterized protein DUF6484